MDSFLGDMITARLKRTLRDMITEVNGTEYTDVAVPLICMTAGLQIELITSQSRV